MKRALVAPVLSVIMPGLGQLINRQAGKGALMVGGAGMIFLGIFGVFLYKLNLAWVEVSALPQAEQTMLNLHKALLDKGIAPLVVLILIYLALLFYAVWDAYSAGRSLDAKA